MTEYEVVNRQKQHTQVCYKVVRGNFPDYRSACVENTPLYYRCGEITKPEFGQIFVFDTLYNAEQFIKGDRWYTILKCKCDNLDEPTYRLEVDCRYSVVVDFWRGVYKYSDLCRDFPPGTKLTNWVEVFAIVNNNPWRLE